jgi:hypothetical protein
MGCIGSIENYEFLDWLSDFCYIYIYIYIYICTYMQVFNIFISIIDFIMKADIYISTVNELRISTFCKHVFLWFQDPYM